MKTIHVAKYTNPMDPSDFFGAFQQKILAQWRFAVSFDLSSSAPGLFVEPLGSAFPVVVMMATSWRFDEWRPKNDGSTITMTMTIGP